MKWTRVVCTEDDGDGDRFVYLKDKLDHIPTPGFGLRGFQHRNGTRGVRINVNRTYASPPDGMIELSLEQTKTLASCLTSLVDAMDAKSTVAIGDVFQAVRSGIRMYVKDIYQLQGNDVVELGWFTEGNELSGGAGNVKMSDLDNPSLFRRLVKHAGLWQYADAGPLAFASHDESLKPK